MATEIEETREELIKRWKAEGNWDAAKGWIRNVQKRIKTGSSSLTESEATGQAYEQARLRWPPTGEDLSEDDIVHIAASKGSMDVARDVEWAYEHLRDQRARADQAPSGGAWSMLQYAREARHKFLELVAKYDAQRKKEQEKEAEEFTADAADHSKMYNKLLAITERVHADAIRDALRQCPDEVVKVLRKAGYLVVEPTNVPPSLETPDSEATDGPSRPSEGSA